MAVPTRLHRVQPGAGYPDSVFCRDAKQHHGGVPVLPHATREQTQDLQGLRGYGSEENMKKSNQVTARDLDIFLMRDFGHKFYLIATRFGMSIPRAHQIWARVSRLKDLGNWELVGENRV